ncbi:MAG: hypothetical protein WCG47_19010, partial [Dermatophilaceae bacterium]
GDTTATRTPMHAHLTAVKADDRVLPATRAVAVGIFPFLVAGFVILYVFPDRTTQLFAWTIAPTMTSMVLASAYGGGAYFFARVFRENRWHTVKAGFPAVALFATVLGVATVVHWDRFNHPHPAFWIWATLYLVAPFIVAGVWLANRLSEAEPTDDAARLDRWARVSVATVGVLALGLGLVMEMAPSTLIPFWPWSLTPLTCRVLGAVFCLGLAGLAVLFDDRSLTVARLVEVQLVMTLLAAAAAVRAHDQLDSSRPLTWVMLAGMGVLLLGGGLLYRQTRSLG